MKSRRGQVVFLEFAGTLPIFCILFMAMMSFHRHYQNTRHAYALARLNNDRMLDTHHSGNREMQLEQGADRDIQRKRENDDLTGGGPMPVTHFKSIEWETRTGRKVTASGWWGEGYAAGYARSGRDNWSHWDIDRQIDADQPTGTRRNFRQESMKFNFHSPNAGSELKKAFLRI